ncbi:MAG: ABC transporter substrate-binding protein [Bacteroidota bacterium]
MNPIRLALDWTPNTNHTGFFIARELGFYVDLNLEVQISDPSEDNYAQTPAKKVELGLADFAIGPSESVISYNTKSQPVPMRAVATLLQEDVSAIVTLGKTPITRPRDLDGKIYASYGARYEDKIVQEMIINDGGKGDIQIVHPDMLGIWNTLHEGQADATWVFLNWEGIEAEGAGLELNAFVLEDYGIPYGYSPVLIARQEQIEEKRPAYRAFLAASKRGFLYVQEHPEKSVEILKQYVPPHDLQKIDLLTCQISTSPYYTKDGIWGRMDPERIQRFFDWLEQTQLETDLKEGHLLFQNDLLDE